MEKLTPQEVPAFVYQMLKLCRHQNSRGLFLRLQHYFGNKVYSRLGTPDSESMDLDAIGKASFYLLINLLIKHFYTEKKLYNNDSIHNCM